MNEGTAGDEKFAEIFDSIVNQGSEHEFSAEFLHGLFTAWERDKEKTQSKIEESKNDITKMQIILGITDEKAAEAVTKLEKATKDYTEKTRLFTKKLSETKNLSSFFKVIFLELASSGKTAEFKGILDMMSKTKIDNAT